MAERTALVETIARALREGEFDPEHAGELFLRADAERAIRAAAGADADILVAGKDGGKIRAASFMGARFAPDLVVGGAGSTGQSGRSRESVAVTVTLLRGDASPVASVLANALVLSGRYGAVVAFLLDRRLGKRNPFGGDEDEPAVRDLSEAERAFLDQLWEQHRVHVELRRQNPFGW